MRSGWNFRCLDPSRTLLSEDREVVDRVLRTRDSPCQLLAFHGGLNAHAVVDSSFNLGAFFIIIPRRYDQSRQRMFGGIKVIDFRERGKPGLPTLLIDDSTLSPAGLGIIKT